MISEDVSPEFQLFLSKILKQVSRGLIVDFSHRHMKAFRFFKILDCVIESIMFDSVEKVCVHQMFGFLLHPTSSVKPPQSLK